MTILNIPDITNGMFEFVGALMVLNHVRVTLKDKSVAGVSIVSTVVFTLWGIWNLFYYPHLGQWASFSGGLCIVVANVIWASLLFRYRG